MSSLLRCVCIVNILVEVSPQDGTVLEGCLRLVPVITLQLVFLWALALKEGIRMVLASFRAIEVLSTELAHTGHYLINSSDLFTNYLVGAIASS